MPTLIIAPKTSIDKNPFGAELCLGNGKEFGMPQTKLWDAPVLEWDFRVGFQSGISEWDFRARSPHHQLENIGF
jgi:hypothetical protein